MAEKSALEEFSLNPMEGGFQLPASAQKPAIDYQKPDSM